MEPGVSGRKDAAACPRVAAVPGRHHAAGLLDDRDQGQDVERLQPGLDHEVDLTERDETIVVAIAAEAPQPYGGADRAEARLLLLRGEEVGAARGEQRLAQGGAGASPYRPLSAAVAVIGMILATPEALAGEGLVHEPKQGPAVLEQPDQRAPERLPENESPRAVDRIDDPTELGVGSHRPEFLADDAVVRVKIGEGGPDRGFGGEVGGGDRIQRRAALVINF